MMNLTDKTKEGLINWWNNGEQDKPLIIGTVYEKAFPQIDNISEYWEKNEIRFGIFKDRLKTAKFYGCAIPHHYVDFGASAMAGALGCQMIPLTFDTIWPSHSFIDLPKPDDICIAEECDWYKTLYNLFNISSNYIEISTTFYALGGINDTLGSLYGEQNLLMDMYDKPDEVKLCLDRISDIWIAEKQKMYSILNEKQDGMASWAGIWAPGSTFPVQDDISFMMSNDMFDEFCLPYIKKCVDSLGYPIYHLDGPGAIKHLDSLLKIDNLRVIQWIPGAGNEEIMQWAGLVKRILNSGRSVQVLCTAAEVGPLVEEVGAKGLLITVTDANKSNMEELEKYIRGL